MKFTFNISNKSVQKIEYLLIHRWSGVPHFYITNTTQFKVQLDKPWELH